MTDLRAAAQDALEAMETVELDIEWRPASPTHKMLSKAITALRAALQESLRERMAEFQRFRAALAEPVQEPDLSRCPKCGGPADNGHDRCLPPNPYHCTTCDQADELTVAYMLGARRRLTVEDLQQALIETDLIDPDAIDDPQEYDNGFTVAQIDALHQRLTA